MHPIRFEKPAAVVKSTLLSLPCLFLAMSFALSGCSKTEKKVEPKKEAPVVTEMNIQKPVEMQAQEKAPKKDEIESLPMDSGGDEEEQLPVLGAGG